MPDHAYHQFPAHETDSLLDNHGPPRLSRIHNDLAQYFHAEVTRSRTDLILLLCYVITGLLDSSAMFIWGSFVSMQTGNTVYLGLGLTGLDSTNRWLKSLVSISSFCIGSSCFAALHRGFQPPPRQRWVLVLSFALQTVCLVVAATIVSIHQSHRRDKALDWKVIVPLALVAFQASGQAVTSRVLQHKTLTSVVLTSVYCDLFSHPGLCDSDQWRRLGAVVGLLLGTCVGGLWAKTEVGLSGALWTAVAVKGLITVAWMGWKHSRTAAR